MRAIALARPMPMRSIFVSRRFIRPMPARILFRSVASLRSTARSRPGSGNSFSLGHGLKIEKSFTFQKTAAVAARRLESSTHRQLKLRIRQHMSGLPNRQKWRLEAERIAFPILLSFTSPRCRVDAILPIGTDPSEIAGRKKMTHLRRYDSVRFPQTRALLDRKPGRRPMRLTKAGMTVGLGVAIGCGHAVAEDAAKGSADHIKAVTSAVDGASIKANTATSKDWPTIGLDDAETRFSKLNQINTDNVQIDARRRGQDPGFHPGHRRRGQAEVTTVRSRNRRSAQALRPARAAFVAGRLELERQAVLHQHPAALLDLLDLRHGVGEVIGLGEFGRRRVEDIQELVA
jgi:hypothetical protein